MIVERPGSLAIVYLEISKKFKLYPSNHLTYITQPLYSLNIYIETQNYNNKHVNTIPHAVHKIKLSFVP